MEMDFDPSERTPLEPLTHRPRVKSPQRLKYDAEIQLFRSRFGGLEEVRKKLGFSRRKMCQILLVDPSAWTRWTRDEERVPPHIYRALEWYLALEGRHDLHPKLSQIYMNSVGIQEQDLSRVMIEQLVINHRIKRLKQLIGTIAVGFALVSLAFWLWK